MFAVQTKHTTFVRDLVRRICPSRIREAVHGNSPKFVWVHIRGKKKREELPNILTQMRKAVHAK
ncbi:hypothetical protein HA402_003209 [Bradysia odoriphaga]|nr:hypothetical protein HA402_003209 [Bradysia odoriphaga]